MREGIHKLSGCQVPIFRYALRTCRQQRLTVRGDIEPYHLSHMRLPLTYQGAIGEVPDANRAIFSTADRRTPIGRQACREDNARVWVRQFLEQSAGSNIIEPCDVTLASDEQLLPVS